MCLYLLVTDQTKEVLKKKSIKLEAQESFKRSTGDS